MIQVHKTRSWYGSWPRAPKASASTPQLARESILGGTQKPALSSTPELQRFDTRIYPSDASTIEPSTDPAASLPNIPETVTSLEEPKQTEQVKQEEVKEDAAALEQSGSSVIPDENVASVPAARPSTPPRPATSSGWLSWLGKSPLPGAPLTDVEPRAGEPEVIEAQQEPVSAPEPVITAAPVTDPEESTAPDPPAPSTPKAEAQTHPTSVSWLPFWGTTPKPETTQAPERGA